jgi:hypothetical protein
MAVKSVERRICDFCDRQASINPCCLCHKDWCYDHGDAYRPSDRNAGRPQRFAFCDVCAKDLAAKHSEVLKAGENA